MTLYVLEGVAPTVAPGAFVAPDANVIGRVHLEEEASVWWNATVRGDTETIRIGARSNVQDGAVLHADPGYPCVLEPDVTVGHRATVHGATIGAGSLVGIGASVLNGARIGRSCLIGAHALVPEGMEVPDGSLVLGIPARVKKRLDAEQRARLAHAARHYVANARRYRAGLRPVEPAPE